MSPVSYTSTTSTTTATVDFAVVGGMASSRCRRQATAAKTTAQEKRKLLDPAAVGASLRSPLAMRGRRAADSTTTSTTSTTTNTTITSVDFALAAAADRRQPQKITAKKKR